jgi:tetratricopeptide (TPR) repeat protein
MKDDDGARFELSRILAARGQFAEAETAPNRAIRLSSQPLVLYMTKARFELASNQPREALESLQPAERSSPFRHGDESVAPELYSEIAEGRAAAYSTMGNLKDAIEQQQLSSEVDTLCSVALDAAGRLTAEFRTNASRRRGSRKSSDVVSSCAG